MNNLSSEIEWSNIRRIDFKQLYNGSENRIVTVREPVIRTAEGNYTLIGRIQEGSRGMTFTATINEVQYAMLKRKFQKNTREGK